MILQWKRIDPDGPGLHAPQHPGDVGWDLEAAEEWKIAPAQQVDVPVNVQIRLPEGCWGEIRARSSIARMNLQVDSGIIDNGYTGPLFVLLRNMNRASPRLPDLGVVTIVKGMRIGQLILHRAIGVTGVECDFNEDTARGHQAFGSTGGLGIPNRVRF